MDLSRQGRLLDRPCGPRYSLKTSRTALGGDRWHRVLKAAELLTDTSRALEAAAGEFLREVETTALTRSFKRVVLLVMCEGGVMRPAIDGLPSGWHLVSINGKNLYGKFAKIALNVVPSAS